MLVVNADRMVVVMCNTEVITCCSCLLSPFFPLGGSWPGKAYISGPFMTTKTLALAAYPTISLVLAFLILAGIKISNW